jgi:NADPH:quinone reductase-like Zn-dependent oxidoreductase
MRAAGIERFGGEVRVRADGPALAVLATALDEGLLSIDVAARLPLADAAAALDGALSGRRGAIVLVP